MIDLDALKAAGLNSREHSERLLAEHRARQAAAMEEGFERRCGCFGGFCCQPDPCPSENRGIRRCIAISPSEPGGG